MPAVSIKMNYINRLNEQKGAYRNKKNVKILSHFMAVLRVFGPPSARSCPQLFNKQELR
jgi:hypothetical protein